MASWASCAFFDLPAQVRGEVGTESAPYRSVAWLRAACTAVADSDVESVRM